MTLWPLIVHIVFIAINHVVAPILEERKKEGCKKKTSGIFVMKGVAIFGRQLA